jgi:hypothetical protein
MAIQNGDHSMELFVAFILSGLATYIAQLNGTPPTLLTEFEIRVSERRFLIFSIFETQRRTELKTVVIYHRQKCIKFKENLCVQSTRAAG